MDQAPTVGALSVPGDDAQRSKAPAISRPSRNQDQRRKQFEDLALPLLDRLYAMALHMVREPARAEDMVQETYLRAWQNFDRFTLGTHFKAWIFQILTYLFLNERRSGTRRETSVDFSEKDLVAARPEPDVAQSSPPVTDWDRLYPALVDDVVKRALDRLAPEQRAVFLLTTLGELSYQECAEIVDVPIGTVMSRLFRARKQLQEELSTYARERGIAPLEGA